MTPYLWGSNISGDGEAGGAEIEVSTSFSDLLELLNLGFMSTFEGRRGRWILVSDLFAAQLGDEQDTGVLSIPIGPATVSIGPGDIDVTSRMGFLDLRGGYAVLEPDQWLLTLDVFAGARIWYIDADIEVKLPVSVAGPALPPGTSLPGFILSGLKAPAGLLPTNINRSFDESRRWADPILGVRGQYELSPDVTLTMLGDVGGFGIGSASDLSWQAVVTLNYAMSQRWTLRAGYRGLGVDRSAGAEIDLVLYGPIFGATYQF